MAANRTWLLGNEVSVSAGLTGSQHVSLWPSRSQSAIVLLLLVCSLGISRSASAQVDAGPARAWFDSLDYPDLAKAKLVRVATGQSYRDERGLPALSVQTALLVKSKGDSFTVLTFDLQTESYRKTPAGMPELERVGYVEVDLKKSVEEYLKTPDGP